MQPELSAPEIVSTGRDVRQGQRIDLAKLRTLAIGHRTRPVVREGRRADGVRVKATTDELGTTVTEHAKDDRQDVHIRPKPITGQISREGAAAWLDSLAPKRA